MAREPSQDLEPTTAAELVRSGAFFLDVRELEEWSAGHAPGATHIALSELSARHSEVPTDRAVVVVCRSGARSAAAAEALSSFGRDAFNLAGGMNAWSQLGLAVIDDEGKPGMVI